ncbi:MAG: signal peptidase I [Oscillospiraceae bacterium]|nr:signal peptidase I [Oscillospiraceae bacterium]
MNRIWKRVRTWLVPLCLTLLVFLLLRCVLLIGYVPSASMEPTLKENSFIIGTRIYSDLSVGDIVVFRHNGVLMVKRIAAGPGDVIDLSQISFMENLVPPDRGWECITVPDGCYYLLGDNQSDSLDSRYWDEPFVASADIVAKLFIK